MTTKLPNIYVRRFGTREIVSTIPVTQLTERHLEKCVLGLLRNMNTDDYFVDDDEAYKALEAKEQKRDK